MTRSVLLALSGSMLCTPALAAWGDDPGQSGGGQTVCLPEDLECPEGQLVDMLRCTCLEPVAKPGPGPIYVQPGTVAGSSIMPIDLVVVQLAGASSPTAYVLTAADEDMWTYEPAIEGVDALATGITGAAWADIDGDGTLDVVFGDPTAGGDSEGRVVAYFGVSPDSPVEGTNATWTVDGEDSCELLGVGLEGSESGITVKSDTATYQATEDGLEEL